MPTLRDWIESLVFMVLFFLAVGVIDHATPAEINQVEQERTMNRYLTEPEQESLLNVLKQHSGDPLAARDYAWVRALRHSGLRIEEFSLINIGDVMAALRSDYLYIPKQHRKGKRKDHTVYVTFPLRQALHDLLRARFGDDEGKTFREVEPLVVSRHGGRMSVRNYELRLKHWGKLAGLPADFSPHWLRHTRAMNIMRDSTARDPRGIVQRALGHADIRSSGVYTQTPREEVESALNEIDNRRTGRVSKAALRRAYEGRATA